MANLSENHKRHVTSILRQVDNLLAGSAAVLGLPEERLFHAPSIPDATPDQLRVISDNLARFRGATSRFLATQEIERHGAGGSALWQFRVVLEAIKNELEEMTPRRLAGYGAPDAEAIADIEQLLNELYGTLNYLTEYLKNGKAP